MRCSAVFSCPLPPRFRRKLVLPLHTGMGAVPFQRAKAALDLNLDAPAASPKILAAESAPQPGRASNDGAASRTSAVISRSSSFALLVRSAIEVRSSRAMRDDRAVEWLEKDLELSEDSLTTKASGRNHETGEQLMQVPPKAGLHPSAFANEVFEVVDEPLELPRRSIKPSDGQVRFAKRRTSN